MFPAQNNQLEADSLASEDEEDLSDELCPDCQVQRLTHPQVCSGFHTAGNRGKVYQQCPSHTFDENSKCSGFIWREDLTAADVAAAARLRAQVRRPSSQWTFCKSLRCRASSKARRAHKHCTQKFCKDCCYRSVMTCAVSAHNAPAIPSSTPSSTFLSNAGMTPSVSAPHPPSHPLAGPSTLAPAGPYARMIPAHYAAKILRQDFSYTKTTQKEMETLERESETRIWIKFWNTNDQGPITFHPLVSRFPFFEPAKCDDMTRKLGSPCIFYEMLDLRHLRLEEIDEGDEVWISTSGPIKVTADMTLYLRAPDIHTCLRLRTSVNSQTSSPQKHALYGGSDTLDQSPSKKQRTYAPIDESSPPPPTPSPSPSPSRSLSNLSSFSTGLEPPPHGRRSLFPLAYTSDMDAAFHQIQRLPQSYTAEQQFTSVFGFLGDSFRSSTYSDSYNAWLYGDADMIAKAVACGSNPGGEWSRIVTYYRKNMQELKQKGKRSFT